MSIIDVAVKDFLINSLKLTGFPVLGVIIFNILIVISAIVLEEFVAKNNTIRYRIIYEDLELLKTAKKQKILKEISNLTGKDVLKVKIRRVDYKNKCALLEIQYKE